MSSTDVTGERPRRLPIQVPLRPGESVEAFIRRLAAANHLRPSYLRTYLTHPPGSIGSIQVWRLALITGRTTQALTHVFPGINATRQNRTTRQDPDQDGLSAAIRREAAKDELVNTLSRQFKVPRLTVIKAITGQTPRRLQKPSSNNPILEPLAGQIDLLIAANPGASIWSIWKTLTTEHQATVSYGTVRSYVNRVRARTADTRTVQFQVNRARLLDAIRQQADGNNLIARLATLFSVDHATVLRALTSTAPLPARPSPDLNPRDPQRLLILTPLRSHIDAMIAAEPGITISTVWERLVDDHHAEISYATVRDYIARAHRPPRQRTTANLSSDAHADDRTLFGADPARQPGPNTIPGQVR